MIDDAAAFSHRGFKSSGLQKGGFYTRAAFRVRPLSITLKAINSYILLKKSYLLLYSKFLSFTKISRTPLTKPFLLKTQKLFPTDLISQLATHSILLHKHLHAN